MTGNMIGRVFNNRYQITERIGIGGMAEVYRAQDNVLGRLVAVKVMLPQYAADESFTQRFKQEAASAANLQSPYIVNVYDWGQDEGTYYIVMEYVRGSDLKTAINQRGALRRPRPRHHPSRHQAAEHHGAARRQREGHGLRHRTREELHQGTDLQRAGHCSLYLPRAGAGQGAHRRQRHLLARHRAVRVRHGQAALRRPRCGQRRHEAGSGRARAATRAQP